MTADFDEIYKMYSPQIFRVCMDYVNNLMQASAANYCRENLLGFIPICASNTRVK
jgi:hypothetical protein